MDKEMFVELSHSVDDFRRWVLPKSGWRTSPTTRGLLAEYFVRCALGIDSKPAEEWNYVDIECDDGTKIEIKSAAYLQPGKCSKLQLAKNPKFVINKKKCAWSVREWRWLPASKAPKRWADLYVFCLECEEASDTYNPLDLSQWRFFVILTAKINEKFGDQKTVTAARLKQEGFIPVSFEQLASEISRVKKS